MSSLHVTYAIWKQVSQNHPGWVAYHYDDGDDGADVWTGDRDHLFSSSVDADDYADWAAAFPTSVSVSAPDDAVAQIKGLRGLAASPVEEDGKPTVVISPAQTGWGTWFTSHGDDLSPTPPASGRGDGAKIEVAFAIAETKETVFQWSEPVQIHDGELNWDPADWDHNDEVSFSLKMPASVATANAGAGNCNLVNLGGYNLIVPAAGDGSHDVDLAQVVPLLSRSSTGYWDADRSTGAVAPSATPGAAGFNLLDIPIESFLIKNLSLGNPLGQFSIDAYKAEWISDRAQGCLKVVRSSTGAGTLSAWVMCFRESTS